MNKWHEPGGASLCTSCGKEEAVFRLNSQRFVDGQKKGSGGARCAKCLMQQLVGIPNAHHFIYRADAPYQPDSANYDNLLKMSVRDCAKYRHESIAEFMRIDGKELMQGVFQFYWKLLRGRWKRYWFWRKYR